jgi:hypothetical protein
MYRGRPTKVKILRLAAEVQVPDDDTRFVVDCIEIHLSFGETLQSIKEAEVVPETAE